VQRSLAHIAHGRDFRYDMLEQIQVEQNRDRGRWFFRVEKLEELVADTLGRYTGQIITISFDVCQRGRLDTETVVSAGADGAQHANGIAPDRLGAALAEHTVLEVFQAAQRIEYHLQITCQLDSHRVHREVTQQQVRGQVRPAKLGHVDRQLIVVKWNNRPPNGALGIQ